MNRELSRLYDVLPLGVLIDNEPQITSLDCLNDPWQILVGIGLSPMTKDETLGWVLKQLFQYYPSPEYAWCESVDNNARRIIKPLGLIDKRMKFLNSSIRYFKNNGSPQTLKEVLEIEGVGSKVANLYLDKAFGKKTITIDTHCRRVLTRMGLWCRNESLTRESLMIELEKVLWDQVNLSLFELGRTICSCSNPGCVRCPVKDKCEI